MITPVSCEVPNRRPDQPKLVGQNTIRVLPGTRLAEHMGAGQHAEGFFCNYEVNQHFVAQFEAAGLRLNAVGPQGELRGFELVDHPFFMATLFQPQLTSVHTGQPHALIVAYLREAKRGLDRPYGA